MATILESLVNSWTVLIMAGVRSIDEVPENFTLGGISHPLKQMVLDEIRNRQEE